MITFVVTASGMTAFGIGAPFWGLLAGVGSLRHVLVFDGDAPEARS